ncbi:MAG: hypothetical protein H0X11_09420 [Betaproteobacteria bacterium]|nr:hypothetical protein [Betaproteobacteria bacterium]
MRPTFDSKPRCRAFAATLFAALIVAAHSPHALAQGAPKSSTPAAYPQGGSPGGGGMSLDQLSAWERQDMGIAAPRELFSGQFHSPTPNQIPGGQVITTKGLIPLLQQGMQVHVFDVLGGPAMLPNAIPAAWAGQPGNFDDPTQQRLAQMLRQATSGQADAPLVFYCGGPLCWMSYNAAARAIRLGYRNVLWYRGGTEAWQRAGQQLAAAHRQAPGQARAPISQSSETMPPGSARPQGLAPQPQRATNATGVQKFSLMTIFDPGVNNIAAVQVMVPQGWAMNGRVVWLPEYSVASNLELVLRDPKNGMSMQWLPTQSFSFMPNAPMPMKPGTNYMGRVWMQPIGDPARFVQWFYAQTLPHLRDAKFVAGEEFPNQAKFHMAQMTAPGKKHVRTVRMRYEFKARDGQPWEEDVFLTLTSTNNPDLVFWDVFAAHSVRGPKGSLDQFGSVTRAVLNSTQFTPEWLAAHNVVKQLFTQGLKQMMRDSVVMGQKLAEYREHISKMRQQIYEDRIRSMDARNEAFREVLGGVENYKDPFQHQPVYLPAGYKEYWANSKGEYVLSEQTGYNPNVGATTEWRKIERIDPMRR